MYQKGVTMKKLSKSLVKQLIYEVLAEQTEKKFKVSVKGDRKDGFLTQKDIDAIKQENPALTDDDFKIEPIGEENNSITAKTIDKMVREEVSRYYGAK
jgi:hypothetical protein|tara:strand:+ start:206 stop:499 length:294 start_codon:yes stop_codon:yes gene_type:complete